MTSLVRISGEIYQLQLSWASENQTTTESSNLETSHKRTCWDKYPISDQTTKVGILDRFEVTLNSFNLALQWKVKIGM